MTDQPLASPEPSSLRRPSLWTLAAIWAKIGILSFGGPTAQIALMHRLIVEQKKWLNEKQYLEALSFCMLLPGPEAMQLATYIGWRLRGLSGGLISGSLFVLPGALVVLVLSIIYARLGKLPLIEAVFLGIKATVLMIVVQALLTISKRALKNDLHRLLAVLSFIAIFLLGLPFPVIIFAAAIIGYLLADGAPPLEMPSVPMLSPARTASVIGTWLLIWFGPLILVMQLMGSDHVLTQLGWFFSKLAVVTFGGAYAVLAYMGQDVVTNKGWLEAGQMIDGLGLAETTPGPLILVTQFVGFLAAYQQGGGNPLIMGIMGTLVALWATFIPCFLWIFTGAPFIDWITAQPRLSGALTAITAAVVGVILNLAVWFALHVFFAEVQQLEWGPAKLWLPHFNTLDPKVLLMTGLSGFLLFVMKWNLVMVLGTAAVVSAAIQLAT